MFAESQAYDYSAYTDQEMLTRKINLKIFRQYSNIGKVPGVLLEDNKRRKLLKTLDFEAGN